MSLNTLEQIPEEILRKIGRNVLLFQQMEGILKILATFHFTFSFGLSELEELKASDADTISQVVKDKAAKDYEQHVITVNKRTLGTLATRFAQNVCISEEESKQRLADASYAPDAIIVSSSFHLISEGERYDKLRLDVLEAVKGRNDLIHCFFQKFDLNSPEGIDSAIQHLDKQQEMVLPIIEDLKDTLLRITGLKQEQSEFLTSEVGKNYLYLPFGAGAFVWDLLRETSERMGRSDGWTDLGRAGQILRKRADEPLKAAMAYHKQNRLKRLLEVSGWFEIKEEATATGGIKTLYRLKEELSFDRQASDSIQ